MRCQTVCIYFDDILSFFVLKSREYCKPTCADAKWPTCPDLKRKCFDLETAFFPVDHHRVVGASHRQENRISGLVCKTVEHFRTNLPQAEVRRRCEAELEYCRSEAVAFRVDGTHQYLFLLKTKEYSVYGRSLQM